MTDRERLIDLMRNAPTKDTVYGNVKLNHPVQTLQTIADHLLANGVIVPPCKVEDIVYSVFNGEVRELKVISYSVLNSTAGNYKNIHTVNGRGAVLSYELRDMGKTVFLTKEEVENALKEREAGAV